MKRIILFILACNALQSADVITVDPAGKVVIAGSIPATSSVGIVSIGGGLIRANETVCSGTVTAGRLVANDATNAINTSTGVITTPGGGSFGKDVYSGAFFVNSNAAYNAGGHVFQVGSGDTNPRLAIYNSGTLLWGPGNTPGDTSLYRDAVGSLKTETAFSAANVVVSRTTPATEKEVVRGDDPRINAGSIKAWVNFDGKAATVSIRGAFNVSSVERIATGQYRVNFTTPFASASYVPIITCGPEAMTAYFNQVGALTTTSVSFVCINGPLAATNASIVTVAVMGF